MGLLETAKVFRLVNKASKLLAKGLGTRPVYVHREMLDVLNGPLTPISAKDAFGGRDAGNQYDMVVFLVEFGLYTQNIAAGDELSERLFGTLRWWKRLGLYEERGYGGSLEFEENIRERAEAVASRRMSP